MGANEDILEIEIFSSTGTKIFENSIREKQTQFDISHAPNGIYLVKLVSDAGIVNRKIVINH